MTEPIRLTGFTDLRRASDTLSAETRVAWREVWEKSRRDSARAAVFAEAMFLLRANRKQLRAAERRKSQ